MPTKKDLQKQAKDELKKVKKEQGHKPFSQLTKKELKIFIERINKEYDLGFRKTGKKISKEKIKKVKKKVKEKMKKFTSKQKKEVVNLMKLSIVLANQEEPSEIKEDTKDLEENLEDIKKYDDDEFEEINKEILEDIKRWYKDTVDQKFLTFLINNNIYSLGKIRKKYKKESLKNHPDRRGGNIDKFQKLNKTMEMIDKHKIEDLSNLDEKQIDRLIFKDSFEKYKNIDKYENKKNVFLINYDGKRFKVNLDNLNMEKIKNFKPEYYADFLLELYKLKQKEKIKEDLKNKNKGKIPKKIQKVIDDIEKYKIIVANQNETFQNIQINKFNSNVMKYYRDGNYNIIKNNDKLFKSGITRMSYKERVKDIRKFGSSKTFNLVLKIHKGIEKYKEDIINFIF
jgi:hypothetical protein